MEFDFKRIEEAFGKTVKDEMEEESTLVESNLKFLFDLGFRSLEDIFYSYAIAFLQDEQKFQEKVLLLCEKYGEEYLYILDSHVDLWEEIL